MSFRVFTSVALLWIALSADAHASSIVAPHPQATLSQGTLHHAAPAVSPHAHDAALFPVSLGAVAIVFFFFVAHPRARVASKKRYRLFTSGLSPPFQRAS